MTETTKRWRGLQPTAIGVGLALACVGGLSERATAADWGAYGFLGTAAAGGTPVTHQTYAADELLEDDFAATTIGSDGNEADAEYHGALWTGITGTLVHSHRPALDTGEGSSNASTYVKIFDLLTFTLPPGDYPDDVYAILYGDYDGYLGATGDYGSSVSQSIEVYLGYERFYEYFLDHGDEANDGFYASDFMLATKLLNGGQVLTVPFQTSRQVSVYLYTAASTPGYVAYSAETADSDFANTVRVLDIEVPEGVTWSSASGVFLAPEPSGHAMLVAGVGALMLLGYVRGGRRASNRARA